jgi:hypothetical protein
VHAGRLLIAHRERDAIPLFIEILLDEEKETLAEWFETDLHHYGPILVPDLLDIFKSDLPDGYTRITAIEILTNIATRFLDARQPIIRELRAQLPPLREDGTVDIEDPDDDEIELWTFIADALGVLGDKRSLDHVRALHEQGLIEERIYGDFEAYRREYFSPKGFHRPGRRENFDIYRSYGYQEK